MINKTFKLLRSVYVIIILVIIISFVVVVLYMDKHQSVTDHIGLERWSIILTLVSIFGALKLLHPKKKNEETLLANIIIKSYISRFFARVLVLILIYYFNLTCYYFTGTKNFIYLAFIIIFALFLCSPNKSQIDKSTDIENNK